MARDLGGCLIGYPIGLGNSTIPLKFLLILASDHITGATGKSPTVTIQKNLGAFAAPLGAVTEISSGWYAVAANATDANTLGSLLLHASASGCDPRDDEFSVVNYNPTAFTPHSTIVVNPSGATLTALGVINGAFELINVKDQVEPLQAAWAIDGLRRLNNMIRLWETESLTIPYVDREVFPLVANQNTYTIGPGGQFETSRPMGLEGASLLLNANPQSFAITIASPTNQTFTVAGNHTASFVPGAEFEVIGSTGNDGTYTAVSSSFSTVTTITVLDPVNSAVGDGAIKIAVPSATTGIEIPCTLVTDDMYQDIRLKGLTNPLFTAVYYNPTFQGGLGSIFLWPTPDTAANNLVIYRGKQMRTFATLTSQYDCPPGYQEALEYNLAKRLLTPYSVSDSTIISGVVDGARSSLASIKRANMKLSDLENDAMRIGGDRRAGYNLFTGNY